MTQVCPSVKLSVRLSVDMCQLSSNTSVGCQSFLKLNYSKLVFYFVLSMFQEYVHLDIALRTHLTHVLQR